MKRKSNSPSWLREVKVASEEGGKTHAKAEGKKCPKTDGPSTRPAVISPTTGGWPIRRNTQPKTEAESRTTPTATIKCSTFTVRPPFLRSGFAPVHHAQPGKNQVDAHNHGHNQSSMPVPFNPEQRQAGGNQSPAPIYALCRRRKVDFVYISEHRRFGFTGVIVDVAAQVGDFFDFGLAVAFRFRQGIEHQAGAVFTALQVVAVGRALYVS